ncbi:SusC/RagA family TonB-linked outer membrane protein [Echinicola strongylocentroti]|uniref:SusC/RagA family TonB-linked outer membrane protein n=1 Tax=Echinicola strongylocentroti TaxID=1795355 RepID=A0A2Z4IQA5_9BACT|nr:TonB-dependent receptor [Echinicola strongylocentroti]AWW32889.1 SusC/RagA family TonB-linked outer membrane protein [Echinicola strongylocentroti]
MRKNVPKAYGDFWRNLAGLFLLLTFACCHVAKAAENLQGDLDMDNVFISLHEQNSTLRKVFSSIESKTSFSFFYDEDIIQVDRKLSLDKENISLTDILKDISGVANLKFRQINHVINVNKLNSTKDTSVISVVKTVTGQVTSENEPMGIPGVTIRVKGGNTGTVTDIDGKFSIEVADGSVVLVFSSIGYKTLELPVGSQTVFNVQLEEDTKALDEVVVVGYGTQKKVNLTGAVSQVSSEMLENRPVANVGQALQGTIANLNVGISNGSPNTSPSFNIRGGTSFSGGSFQTGSPLILVDGVEMDINQLNPEDIESVSVLKDAASAAIYGSRAAYGVVLVTTKKGAKGERTKISYSNSFQWNKPSSVPDLLDAYTIQEAAIKAEELQNRTPSSDMQLKLENIQRYMDNPESELPYFMDAGDNIIWVGNTQPYEAALRNYSPMQKHNLNLSGGSDKSSYYASLGYQGQDGLYKINTDMFKRYNMMLNVNNEVTDWFSVEFRTSYSQSNYSEPVSPSGKGGWWTAMSQEPSRNINMPIMTPMTSPVGEMYTDNILSFMDYGSRNDETKENILLAIAPTIHVMKGWDVKANISYKSYDFRRKQVIPELERIENRWDAPTTVHTNPSSVQRWNQHSDQFTINVFTDYSLTVDDHEFYVLGGFNQESYKYTYLGGRGEQILTPYVPVISQTLGNEYAYDNESEWALRGAFYRFTYNYDNRYLIESNGRYDGTSRFPSDRRFKFFPSLSGAWRISEESWAEGLRPVVNELKLRASYGSLGNQNVSNYIYIPSYGTTAQISYLFDGVRPVGITPPGLVNADLTWETATTIDVGFDVAIFDKLDLSFDWYERTTKDILVAGDKYPAVLGTSSPTKNSGEMTTTGWEVTAKWRDVLDNGVRYDLSLNLSDYQSEITEFNGNPNKLLSSLYTGQVMGEIWGYETAGLFQNQEQIDNAPSQELINSGLWFPGDVQYHDLDGDGEVGPGESTAENSGDRKIIGNSTPRYQFGLNMNVFWKGFDLNIFFQGVGKRDVWIGSNLFWGGIAGGTGTYEVYENSWTPERTDAYFPGYRSSGANRQTQTRYLQNAAYLRLKNISLGYTLPKTLTERIRLDRVRVYTSAYNIWEATSVPDTFDPEVLSGSYPMLRSLAAGMQITF